MAGLVQNRNFVHQRKLSAKMKHRFSKVRHFINMQNVVRHFKNDNSKNSLTKLSIKINRTQKDEH